MAITAAHLHFSIRQRSGEQRSSRRGLLGVRSLVGVALLGAALSGGMQPGASHAQEPADATATTLTLVSQDPWTPIGGELTLRIGASVKGKSAPDASLIVRASVYGAVNARGRLDAAADGKNLGTALGRTEYAWGELVESTSGARNFTLGLQDPTAPRDTARIRVRSQGIYPLKVELVDDSDDALATFITFLVATAPTPATNPLAVAWVFPITTGPARLPNGSLREGFRADVSAGGRLDRLAGAVSAASDVPLSLVLGPETLESWQLASDTESGGSSAIGERFDSLRAAVAGGGHQILAAPYVPLDMPSLEASGLGPEVSEELAGGADVLSSVFGVRPGSSTVYAEKIDPASLARLRASGTASVVVRSDSLEPRTSRLTPALPFAIISRDRRFAAVADEPALSELVSSSDMPGLSAQRVLATLSLIALEAPSKNRGVVIAPDMGWSPPGELTGLVIAGLRSHPLLKPMTIDELVASVPPETTDDEPVVRSLVEVKTFASTLTPADLRDARLALSAFEELAGADHAALPDGRRNLLIALSSHLGNSRIGERPMDYVAEIDRVISEFVIGIRAPVGRTVTLTGASSEIPISFQNTTGQSVKVRVHLESEKLVFPGGSDQVLEIDPTGTTATFTVEPRASGTFPLLITITSPDTDGALLVQRTRITVRSTIVGDFGLIITSAAALFLAIWWGNHIRRARRTRRAEAHES